MEKFNYPLGTGQLLQRWNDFLVRKVPKFIVMHLKMVTKLYLAWRNYYIRAEVGNGKAILNKTQNIHSKQIHHETELLPLFAANNPRFTGIKKQSILIIPHRSAGWFGSGVCKTSSKRNMEDHVI